MAAHPNREKRAEPASDIVEPASDEQFAPERLAADFEAQCVLSDDRLWRFHLHVLRPIFVGSNVPISLSIDPQHLSAPRASDGQQESCCEDRRAPAPRPARLNVPGVPILSG